MADFKVRTEGIDDAASRFKSIQSTLLGYEEEIRGVANGLNFKIAASGSLRTKINTIAKNVNACAVKSKNMSSALNKISDKYRRTENEIKNKGNSTDGTNKSSDVGQGSTDNKSWWDKLWEQIKEFFGWTIPASGGAYEINSIVFGDKPGQYGGDQGSPMSYYSGSEKKALYDIVRRYYPNMTDAQVRDYLIKLNSEGCGYVAVVNTIFAAYEGREAEFERTFGFSMRKANGDLNFDRLLVDYYSATDNHNKGWFGVDKIDTNEDSSSIKGSGTSSSDREYRIHLYLDDKNVDVSIKNSVNVTPENFQSQTKDGYIIISYHYGNLQREDGSKVYIDGGHAMVVTGVTDDGRYIVSSWGEKYYIDPNDIVSEGGNRTSFHFDYYSYK